MNVTDINNYIYFVYIDGLSISLSAIMIIADNFLSNPRSSGAAIPLLSVDLLIFIGVFSSCSEPILTYNVNIFGI